MVRLNGWASLKNAASNLASNLLRIAQIQACVTVVFSDTAAMQLTIGPSGYQISIVYTGRFDGTERLGAVACERIQPECSMQELRMSATSQPQLPIPNTCSRGAAP